MRDFRQVVAEADHLVGRAPSPAPSGDLSEIERKCLREMQAFRGITADVAQTMCEGLVARGFAERWDGPAFRGYRITARGEYALKVPGTQPAGMPDHFAFLRERADVADCCGNPDNLFVVNERHDLQRAVCRKCRRVHRRLIASPS